MGRERLFEGGDYFKYFYQRRAIIRGRRLIEGRLLFEEIRLGGRGVHWLVHYKSTSHKFLKASEASLNEQKQGSEIYFILFYFILLASGNQTK